MYDTDIWSAGDEDTARRAGEFFAAVRSLLDCPEVTLLAAVQSHWVSTGSLVPGSDHTAPARLRFTELRQRAGRVLTVPASTSHDHARALVRAVLDRRIEITLEPPTPESEWVDAVLSDGAIEVLAKRRRKRSLQQRVTDARRHLRPPRHPAAAHRAGPHSRSDERMTRLAGVVSMSKLEDLQPGLQERTGGIGSN
jgi:hypothetical protein